MITATLCFATEICTLHPSSVGESQFDLQDTYQIQASRERARERTRELSTTESSSQSQGYIIPPTGVLLDRYLNWKNILLKILDLASTLGSAA